ncbi:MAG: hypothetical protein AUJ74_01255 [Candidatus Omnitrophica bacterium CG1_02_44_16]|nr:MAG: hypothetical protein AUJ74_01255 [Candidatus Omnitrophica bacterium CG1_02_44_16]PIY82456.1 MAG: hypothetical protein COY78_06385 [Candidatus Omnitrophica bacterium CG_4_10_14_0_8_um_filter_44_12]PIZ84656.1 MAG: hypothetical protein COX96_02555 [Candidatus Omnitrophica bacterium CG_4_10_14_0_2_um_filter_44_9]
MLKKFIPVLGLTEIVIGTTTFIAITHSLNSGVSTKPPNTLAFIVLSSFISASLGAGILMRWEYSRKLFIFFAGWIILSKILIFTNIITLNGALETTVPLSLKNAISCVYHLLAIFYFHHPGIKAEFKHE